MYASSSPFLLLKIRRKIGNIRPTSLARRRLLGFGFTALFLTLFCLLLPAAQAQTAGQVKYFPRTGCESRMTGGVFQSSQDNSTYTDLYAIATQPADGQYSIVPLSVNLKSYRCLRCFSPAASDYSVAEVSFYTGTGAGAVKLTGTAFGTPGSYGSSGAGFTKVFDGSTATYFDVPTASGAFAGIDQGTASLILTSIAVSPSTATLTTGGTQTFTTSPRDPAGFGGQFGYYTDTETGLLCLTHRYYDPGTGKFINRDPIGYAGGANLYAFCGGNPINEEDEDGFAPTDRIVGKTVVQIHPDKLWMRPNNRGSAPIGEDGRGVEIHHAGQNPDGPFVEMTMRDHRGPGNKGLNHTPGLPGIDHGPEWTYSTERYWARQWDTGRFESLPAQPGPTPRKGWLGMTSKIPRLGKAGKVLGVFGLLLTVTAVTEELKHKKYLNALDTSGILDDILPLHSIAVMIIVDRKK